MPRFNKDLWHVAEHIHRQLLRRQHGPNNVALPENGWLELQELSRQIQRSRQRGWHGAARERAEDLAFAVNSFRQRLTEVSEELHNHRSLDSLASIGDIYRDLAALFEEFDDIHGDFEEQELCVTTAPIVLDGLYLGPFQIRLNWAHLDHSLSYRVVALVPHPARTNDSVTHPHVSDETVCEGDGREAIRMALQQGRIGDFFLLVGRLLQTYASGSAYVEISVWDGTPCTSCGASVDDDDRSYCQRCDVLLCLDCCTQCSGCEDFFCNSCAALCNGCDAYYCGSCMEICCDCSKEICESCLTQGRCPKCEGEHQEHEDSFDDETSINSPAQIQPDGMGEATVST